MQPTEERSLDDVGERRPLLQTVDAALASLRGRGALSGSEVSVMLDLLGDALAAPPEATEANTLGVGALAAFRGTTVPTAIVADQLLDLRLAVMADARDADQPSLVR